MRFIASRLQWANAIVGLSCLLAATLGFTGKGHADEITIKFGTLGPKGTSVALAVEAFLDAANNFGKNIGHHVKVSSYYGGVMGDEPEMEQKARIGQLDIVTPNMGTLPRLVPAMTPYYLPFLVNSFGESDYLMRRGFLKVLAEEVYKQGFIMLGFMTEGMYDLYYRSEKEIRTPDQARKLLKAANWSGAPHDNVYIPLGIPQVPVSVPEVPTLHKMGMVNADLSPAVWVIGVQLYALRPMLTMIQPSFATGGGCALLTKGKFDKLPWDFKLGIATMLPIMMYVVNGQFRDSHYAFIDAMIKYGMKKEVLSKEETKAWRDPLVAYHKTYLQKNPAMRPFYQDIVNGLSAYNEERSPERTIYETDPEYVHFPDKLKGAARAIRVYLETGSLTRAIATTDPRYASPEKLKEVEHAIQVYRETGLFDERAFENKFIEGWRVFEPLLGAEKFASTGDPRLLKAWCKKFIPDVIIDEAFNNHMTEVKKLFGTKEAIKMRAQEWLAYLESKKYTGYHKGAK